MSSMRIRSPSDNSRTGCRVRLSTPNSSVNSPSVRLKSASGNEWRRDEINRDLRDEPVQQPESEVEHEREENEGAAHLQGHDEGCAKRLDETLQIYGWISDLGTGQILCFGSGQGEFVTLPGGPDDESAQAPAMPCVIRGQA